MKATGARAIAAAKAAAIGNMGRTVCDKVKMGEYNMLRCFREHGHAGECSFAVDNTQDDHRKRARKLGLRP